MLSRVCVTRFLKGYEIIRSHIGFTQECKVVVKLEGIHPSIRLVFWVGFEAPSLVGPTKFDTTRKHDMNLTRFLRVWVEYNRV